MVPFSGVNLVALCRRLTKTCSSRVGSPSTQAASSGTDATSCLVAQLAVGVCRFDRLANHVIQAHPFPAHADLALRHTRDFQQIVDHPHHLRGLAVDDLAGSGLDALVASHGQEP
jgi:hypothetical protein